MSVEYIDSILRRALGGDISVRLDEHEVEPEAAGLAGTMNRVLERLAEAEKLENQKKRADSFVRHNPQAIAVLSGDKGRLAINKKYEQVWHGSHDELMAKKLYDFDITLTGGDDFYASFQTKRQAVSDFEVSWPDGNKSYLRLFQVPILNARGDIDVNYYIYQDFTPEKALAAYNQVEMDRVARNLALFSKGDLSFDLEVTEAGRVTGEARQAFLEINSGFKTVQEAFRGTITDIGALENEIRAGHVRSRADLKNHAGEFATILESMNSALDAFTAPIQETMRLANEYAGGNFTARTDESIEYSGDFLDMRESLDNIGISVSELVGQAKKTISHVGVGTSEASKGSDEVAKAAEQVAMTSQKCADLSKELLMEIEDIGTQITDLSSSNEEVASTAQGILKNAQNVADMGEDARALGEDANVKMASVESITNQSMQEIGGLREQMGEINKIVRMITDIASQINLLALNAAIEAAHAGEHGRGFAVVAGEVKELAGEARTATEKIETVIEGVQKSTEKTAEAIGSANAGVSSGVESVNKTIEALNRMVKGAGSVTEDIGEIARAINDQAMITGNVVRAVDKGTGLTKETQTEVEELAALAEEASASIEEIGNAIHEVDQMADQVQNDMNRFRV